MTLTIEDRIEIQDLLARYCFHIDELNWEGFSDVFHPHASLDFTAIGGIKGSRQELVDFLKAFSKTVSSWQHTTSTNRLKCETDYVESKTAAQVMTVTAASDNTDNVAFFGLWYNDKIVKEQGAWLIKERVLQPAWTHNVPAQTAQDE